MSRKRKSSMKRCEEWYRRLEIRDDKIERKLDEVCDELKPRKDKIRERLDGVYDELKHRENKNMQDFSSLYTSLNISIAFYGTVIVFRIR